MSNRITPRKGITIWLNPDVVNKLKELHRDSDRDYLDTISRALGVIMPVEAEVKSIFRDLDLSLLEVGESKVYSTMGWDYKQLEQAKESIRFQSYSLNRFFLIDSEAQDTITVMRVN